MSETASPEPTDVLVVDDEPDMLEAVAELLEGDGFSVSVASNGQDALDWLDAGGRPRVVLLDLRMPVLDGWGFCEGLATREGLRRTPVAIVSATAAGRPLPERVNDAGFFRKPVDWSVLLGVVRKYARHERQGA